MPLIQKLEILADAAKYDVSCASSGATKRKAGKGEIGSTGRAICHAYTPDGRCVSLLKILLTNFCISLCRFCRRPSPRARDDAGRAGYCTLSPIRLAIRLR
jgi:predicted DNA-binding helix-hairpin-helix protein